MLKPDHVELLRPGLQTVTTRLRHQHLAGVAVLQHTSQPRHRHPRRVQRAVGQLLAEQLVDQLLGPDQLIRMHQQEGQQRPLALPAKSQRRPTAPRLKRTEHPKPQQPRGSSPIAGDYPPAPPAAQPCDTTRKANVTRPSQRPRMLLADRIAHGDPPTGGNAMTRITVFRRILGIIAVALALGTTASPASARTFDFNSTGSLVQQSAPSTSPAANPASGGSGIEWGYIAIASSAVALALIAVGAAATARHRLREDRPQRATIAG